MTTAAPEDLACSDNPKSRLQSIRLPCPEPHHIDSLMLKGKHRTATFRQLGFQSHPILHTSRSRRVAECVLFSKSVHSYQAAVQPTVLHGLEPSRPGRIMPLADGACAFYRYFLHLAEYPCESAASASNPSASRPTCASESTLSRLCAAKIAVMLTEQAHWDIANSATRVGVVPIAGHWVAALPGDISSITNISTGGTDHDPRQPGYFCAATFRLSTGSSVAGHL